MGGGGGDAQLRHGDWLAKRSEGEPARFGLRQWFVVGLALVPLVVVALLGFLATR